jgi:hypothetical protein
MMKLVFCFIAILIAVASSQPCLPANGALANNVIGQNDFVTINAGTGVNQLNGPYGVTVDPVSRKFFVTDSNNHRIQRYPTNAAFLNGQAAEATFGTGIAGCSANQLNGPAQIAWASGALYITDFNNHRTVRLNNAATAPSGTAFDAVWGALDFGTCVPFAGESVFPLGVALDVLGNLYIADQSPMIARYNAATTKLAGFGQAIPDIIVSGIVANFACTQNTFNNPGEIYIDPFTSTLFAVDQGCNRVLGYGSIHQKITPSSNADFVVGQTTFTGVAPGCTASTFTTPAGVNYNQATNTLFVADAANHRVLGFLNFLNFAAPGAPPTTQFGATATFVMGQTSLTTCPLLPGAANLNRPVSLYYFNQGPAPQFNLFVADFMDNRVLRAECPASTSATVSNTGSNSHSNAPSHSNSNSGSNSFTNAPSTSNSWTVTHTGTGAPSTSNTWTGSTSTSASQSTTESQSFSLSSSSLNCGNAVVNPAEQCDPGTGKFGFASCCNFNCRWKRINSRCGKKPVAPACLTLPRCSLDVTTGAVFCKASKNRKPGKT